MPLLHHGAELLWRDSISKGVTMLRADNHSIISHNDERETKPPKLALKRCIFSDAAEDVRVIAHAASLGLTEAGVVAFEPSPRMSLTV